MPHVDKVLINFKALDKLLQSKGFPATSPWWHETIERWYRSNRRQVVIRAGRRGGKSSTLSRLGVCEALFGDHKIPPGDTGVVAVISTRREEAGERLTTIKAILDALNVAYSPWGEYGIRLAHRPVGFRVYTASVAGVSGFTGIFVFADEVAKWKDNDTGQNPATEVLKSVRPTMATQRNARIVLSSSPVGKWDAHYDAYEAGETKLQIVAHAPTWVANPSVTEEETHELEPDLPTWEREYAAIPQAEIAESLFTDAELDAATRPGLASLPKEPGVSYAAAMDPATSGNAWTLVIGATRYVDADFSILKKSIVHSHEWRGSQREPLSPRAVFREMKPMLQEYGVDVVFSDQASGQALRDIADEFDITLVIDPWTQNNKIQAYKDLQTYVRTEQVELPPVPKLRQDLLGVRRKVNRNGIVIELLKTPDGRHCDFAPSIAKVFSLPLSNPVVSAYTEGSEAHRRALRRKAFLEQKEAEKTSTRDRGPHAVWKAGRRVP